MKIMKKILLFFALTLFVYACNQSDNETTVADSSIEILVQSPSLPSTYFNYANPSLPTHFNIPPTQAQDNTPANNPVTDAGATLGRVLFYDKNLSANNTIACASCHNQADGFSDPDAFSTGFEGGLTGRNSMGLSNAKYYTRGSFFWDERAATLEDQVLMPIQDHVEMGMDLETLITKLEQIDYYPALFEDAFGSNAITNDRVSRALAQFVRSMVSYQSKYDVGRATLTPGQDIATTNFSNFTAEENLGKEVFFTANLGGCGACHGSENFVAPEPRNNGLEATFIDLGVGAITGVTTEEGLFKINSLRNVELTAPYMHDGRFTTLEQVVEHYDNGVVLNPNLSPPLVLPDGSVKRLNLSTEQKAALVAFMKTLTDTEFINDEKFSNPFE